MQQRNAVYTVVFAAAVCLVCSILVTSSAVSLRERQDVNKLLDKQRNVLQAAGMLKPGEVLSEAEVQQRFASFKPVVINLADGAEQPDVDPESVEPRKMVADPEQSHEVPDNLAQVRRVANETVIYKLVNDAGEVQMLVLPVHGKGLWSTLYGFLALSADLQTIKGLTFYDQKETPGLGGEVDNPRWKALWPGRKAFDDDWNVKIEVIKGTAGPPEQDPYHVDGLSGATITSRGVSALLHFWLGEEGFGPYLENYRQSRSAS